MQNRRIKFKDAKQELLRLADFAGEIKLAAPDAPAEQQSVVKVQVMRAGQWEHPWYGQMIITASDLAEFVRNFKANVKRQDLPADYFHESEGEAAGWFKDLYIDGNGQQLWGDIQVTPKCLQMLSDKAIRYFSADFYFQWTDPETGVGYKNVLNGGGFVNRPFIKDMQPVTELSEGNTMFKTLEEAKTVLAERDATIVGKDAEIKKLSDKAQEDSATIATLKAEKAEAAKAKELADKEAAFTKLCADGKACAAQKDAYMSNDMAKFAELAQPLNVVTKGTEEVTEVDNSKKELSDDEKRACKLLNISEEDFHKYNK